LKNKGRKSYNFPKFSKNKNQLRKERGKNRVIEEVIWKKALSLSVLKGAEAPGFVKRRDLSRLEKRG